MPDDLNLEQDDLSSEPSPAEAEARLYGWRPKDEFHGPEDKWRTAEDFLEEGKRINGFLRKDLDKLRAQLAEKDSRIAEIQQTVAEFARFHEETEARSYQRALKELKAARAEALRENDGATVVEIEGQIESLEEARAAAKPPVAKPAQQTPGPDPIWTGWLAENSWFQENPKARAVANGYSELLRAEAPDLVGRAFLDEVKLRVQTDFPELFSNGNRARAAAVSSSGESRGAGASGTRGKTYSDLPADAKAMCDKFVSQKLVKDRETYVREYFEE